MANIQEKFCDISAESGIIATLIYHPEYILHSEYLSSKYFTNYVNRVIYWAINELYKKGITNIDEYNIMNQINSSPEAKKIFKDYDVNTIADIIKYSDYVGRDTLEEYIVLVNRVIELAFKRELYVNIKQWEKLCLNENFGLSQLYKRINKDITTLSEKYLLNSQTVKTYGEVIEEMWNNITSKRRNGKFYGFPWKFPSLNEYCQIEKGELAIIAGQRKTGKSMVLMNQCAYAIQNNIPCLYIDTELTTERFTERLLSHLTGIKIKDLKMGNYTQSQEDIIKETIEYLKQKPFVHIYMPVVEQDEIYALCKMLQYKINLQLVFFDYIKGTSVDSSTQYNELGRLTNFLKNEIGGELDLAVVAGAQLNRDGDIAESFKIEMYASTIINIRPKTTEEIMNDGKECGNYMIWVKLNRNGEQQDVKAGEYIDMYFQGNCATINQSEKQHEILTPFGDN